MLRTKTVMGLLLIVVFAGLASTAWAQNQTNVFSVSYYVGGAGRARGQVDSGHPALRPHGGREHAEPSAGRASQVRHPRAGTHQPKARDQFFDLESRTRRQPALARLAIKLIVGFVLRHRLQV